MFSVTPLACLLWPTWNIGEFGSFVWVFMLFIIHLRFPPKKPGPIYTNTKPGRCVLNIDKTGSFHLPFISMHRNTSSDVFKVAIVLQSPCKYLSGVPYVSLQREIKQSQLEGKFHSIHHLKSLFAFSALIYKVIENIALQNRKL